MPTKKDSAETIRSTGSSLTGLETPVKCDWSFVSCCKVKALVTAIFKQAKLILALRPHHIIPDCVISAEHDRRPEAPGRVDGHAVDRDDRHVDHENSGPNRERSQCLERRARFFGWSFLIHCTFMETVWCPGKAAFEREEYKAAFGMWDYMKRYMGVRQTGLKVGPARNPMRTLREHQLCRFGGRCLAVDKRRPYKQKEPKARGNRRRDKLPTWSPVLQ